MYPLADAKSTNAKWNGLYKLGGAAALIMVAVTFRMVTDAAPPLFSANPNPDVALACFSFGVFA